MWEDISVIKKDREQRKQEAGAVRKGGGIFRVKIYLKLSDVEITKQNKVENKAFLKFEHMVILLHVR